MNTSAFDPQAFLDTQITEALVKRPPLPVGDYTGIIGEPKSRTWTGKLDPSKSGIAIDFPIVLQIPADVQAAMGVSMATLNVKDSIMLDLTDGGAIDSSVGKNGRLRTYREACDMNKAGEPFSFRLMQGKVITVKIKHELWEETILEKVAGVAKA